MAENRTAWIDVCGWFADARPVVSPNANERPPGTAVDLLVIHNISLPPEQYGGHEVEQFFCNRLDPHGHPYFQTIAGLKVSAHLFIRRCGELVQFVSVDRRAWHAGRSRFGARDNCNDFAVGIELEGSDHCSYTDVQYRRLVGCCRALMARFPGIGPDRIVGHADIAPARKTDPGPAFDWPRLRAALLSGERS